ncbi:MAG: hypothetical protein M1480_11015 [Bacteroidetes bacterium]|nr:hypothetical protein [Bacteroidota bacterium]
MVKYTYSKIFTIIIALIFMSSAILKLVDFQSTVVMLQDIISIQNITVNIGLYLLIIIEAFIAAALILNLFKHSIKNLIFFLSTAFIVFNLVLIFKGIDNCGCFGGSVKQSPYLSLIKNILIMIMAYKI